MFPRIGKTERYLMEKIEAGEHIHLTLFDPEELRLEDAARAVKRSEEAGTDGVMLGGSTFFSQNALDEYVKEMKFAASVPVIIFPNNITAISRYADAIWFMSLDFLKLKMGFQPYSFMKPLEPLHEGEE